MNAESLIRFFTRFLPGAVPVDGCAGSAAATRDHTADAKTPRAVEADLERAEAEPHEPLRWGNFR